MAKLIQNKKIRLNYEILEEIEAGIELFGSEVKSIRNKHGSLDGSHISVRGDEAFLIGAHIPPYQPNNTHSDYDPNRVRKLLLHRKEIQKFIGMEKQKGLTIVPISMYTKRRNIKVGIAVVRGKKKYDKRQTIKKKDTQRDIERELKQNFNI